MAVHLFKHNEEAYVQVEQLLARKGKAAVIHPTGTGKSFIGFRLCQAHPQMHVCWLAPSEYIFQSQIRNLESASGEPCPSNITFLTYSRLMNMNEQEIKLLCPDYIILDEFHRCGARRWAEGIKVLLRRFEDAKLVGFSATPIRYLDSGRNMVRELFEQDGMLCIASEMTLGEAIVRGILPSPQYVTTVYQFQQDIEKIEGRIGTLPRGLQEQGRKHYENLRRSLERAEGIEHILARYITEKTGKYIVFCSDWKHVKQLKENLRRWFGAIDAQLHSYTLYSGEPETEKEYIRFQQDDSRHLKILLCIDSLNEGVHIEGVSGVILFRPTVSPIIYKQQIGRALTSGTREKPLIIDVVNNLNNLRSIDTIHDEMISAVHKLRETGREKLILTESFHVYDQAADCRACFERLEKCLNQTWDSYYGAALAYYGEHGDLLVPRRYVTSEGIQLGAWIMTQKAVYADPKKGCITEEQIDRLNKIGMKWGSRNDIAWENGFLHAKDYYMKHGDLLVPDGYVMEDGFQLGQWIAYQRSRRQGESGGLSHERQTSLEAIGMRWDAYDAKWEKHFSQAKEYFEIHGDLQVPATYRTEDGFGLGMWITNQRKAKQRSQGCLLTQDQIRRLEEIGMQWDAAYAIQWQRAYAEAKAYFKDNGNLNVPYAYCTASGFKLGRWIRRQRKAKMALGSTGMTEERAFQLEQIGMKWDVTGS